MKNKVNFGKTITLFRTPGRLFFRTLGRLDDTSRLENVSFIEIRMHLSLWLKTVGGFHCEMVSIG
jgi:hypothetical protein